MMEDNQKANTEKTVYCSFCGKSQNEVRKLIAGPSVFICDEDVLLCVEILVYPPPVNLSDRRKVA